ncbi:hypothetical protein BIY24_12950 [Halobacteriovorax marinus]|uniref:response regulator transcription factor n=1 Tax=Halobacteriovorax marinus TaxID=97084 RepID=UPI000BC2E103|nr:response regulator transcription factor [Halobacteriovorax marinus]ATH08820.1 hypothetical protein BIY24_12950 [Halobacteriovorax marinus]
MEAKIIYFDENIENHLLLQGSIRDQFNVTPINRREVLLGELSKRSDVDLILLDDSDVSGGFFEFLNDVLIAIDKEQVALILISSRDSVENRVKAFDYGVDDFLTRPITANELNARLSNKVEKYKKTSALELEFGNLSISISDQRALIDGRDICLTPIEFKILLTLVRNPDRLHSKDVLVKSLWAGGHYGKSKAIDTHICNLRRKIRGASHTIKSTKGRGIGLTKASVERFI